MNISSCYIKKSGIYCIMNKVTQDLYIGSSKNVYNRLHEHLCMFNKGMHHNTHFQYSWNKHRRKSFVCFVLEYTTDLVIREQYYIDTLKPRFNKNLIVTEPFIRTYTDQQKQQVGDNTRNAWANGGMATRRQKFYVYDLQGIFIEAAHDIKAYAISKNWSKTKIWSALNRKGGMYKDHQFRYQYTQCISVYVRQKVYKNRELSIQRMREAVTGITYSKDPVTGRKKKNVKQYL